MSLSSSACLLPLGTERRDVASPRPTGLASSQSWVSREGRRCLEAVALKTGWLHPSGHFPMKKLRLSSVQFSPVAQSCLFVTPWTAARQASLSITNSRSWLKLMSIESVMPSNHLILCCPLLLLPSIFSSIRVFFNESALCIRWPKYWSSSVNISPSNEHPGLFSFRMEALLEHS